MNMRDLTEAEKQARWARNVAIRDLTARLGNAVRLAVQSANRRGAQAGGGHLPNINELATVESLTRSLVRMCIDILNTTELYKQYLDSAEFATFFEHLILGYALGWPAGPDSPLYREYAAGCHIHSIETNGNDSDFFLFLALVIALFKRPGSTQIGQYYERVKSRTPLGADPNRRNQFRLPINFAEGLSNEVAQASVFPGVQYDEMMTKLRQYRSAARQVFGRIQVPNFDTSTTVSIESLHVVPTFTYRGTPCSIEQLRSSEHRVVILGDPGSGKTTLTRRLSYDLSSVRPDTQPEAASGRTPVAIVLREIEAAQSREPLSIVQYIAQQMESIFQVSISAQVIEWLLLTSRLYVIFDGLDELLDISRRNTLISSVTSFGVTYGRTPILVTSRKIGYAQTPLPPEYKVFSLDEFDDRQVADYARRWFNIDPELPQPRKDLLANSFLRESDEVPDLRRNQLMLALMCAIYRTESYIPQNRPDVYEKCSRMLFDRWDRQRELRRPFEFDAHVEPALMHLAHWIYSDQDLQAGVDETRLIQEAANYLKRWQYDDRARATSAARDFIEFCRGRAWVFTDVGTAGEFGERLYQFTHRTFLEYFTAAHIARAAPDVQSLIMHLQPRILREEWDLVSQLAIQIKAKLLRGGADEAATMLLGPALEATLQLRMRYTSAIFLLRCMAFLTTSPRTTRRVAEGIALLCCDLHSGMHPSAFAENVLDLMYRSARETRGLLVESFGDALALCMRQEHGACREVASSIAYQMLSSRPSGMVVNDLRAKNLVEVTAEVMSAHIDQWPWVPYAKFYDGSLPAAEISAFVPISHLIGTAQEMPGSSYRLRPPAVTAAWVAKNGFSQKLGVSHTREDLLQLISLCAGYLRENCPLDSYDHAQPDDFVFSLYYSDRTSEFMYNMDASLPEVLMDTELVDVATIVAFAFEQVERLDQPSASAWLDVRDCHLGQLLKLDALFAARGGNSSGSIDLLDQLPHLRHLVDWAEQKLNFSS